MHLFSSHLYNFRVSLSSPLIFHFPTFCCSVRELSFSLPYQDFKSGLEWCKGRSHTHVQVLIGEPGTIFSFYYVHCGESCLTAVCGAKHGQDVKYGATFFRFGKAVSETIWSQKSGRFSSFKLF